MKVNRAIQAVANALLDPKQDEKAQTVPLRFPKPLAADDTLMIELLTIRYEGVGAAQFLRVETDDDVTLHVPKIIRRIPSQLARVVS
jgi:hypothetical protein